MLLVSIAAATTTSLLISVPYSSRKHALQEQQAFHVVQTGETAHPSNLWWPCQSTIAPSIPPHLILHSSVLQQLFIKPKCEILYIRARVVCTVLIFTSLRLDTSTKEGLCRCSLGGLASTINLVDYHCSFFLQHHQAIRRKQITSIKLTKIDKIKVQWRNIPSSTYGYIIVLTGLS